MLAVVYINRVFSEKIRRRIMENCGETHTSIADDYEERAENVDTTTITPTPHRTKG